MRFMGFADIANMILTSSAGEKQGSSAETVCAK
jgi:hypothetical protein